MFCYNYYYFCLDEQTNPVDEMGSFVFFLYYTLSFYYLPLVSFFLPALYPFLFLWNFISTILATMHPSYISFR